MNDLPQQVPLVLTPAYKDYVWGGNKIASTFNREVDCDVCAESWEASDRHEGQSCIQNGAFKGAFLKDLIENYPSLFGSQVSSPFPLLIKLIDANQHLSIQVHPNEAKAHLYQGEPKSEMWYIIDAEPNSKIYLGLKKNVPLDILKKAIAEDSLESYMNAIKVKKGETYYIPAGMLHAIGSGCLIYEVQQNSNTTYRLYDWGRKDSAGKSRPLHIEKALNVMLEDQVYLQKLTSAIKVESKNVIYTELVDCPFFTFNKIELHLTFNLKTSDVFRVYFVLEGQVQIRSESSFIELREGQSFLVPANLSDVELISLSENAVILETIPNKR
ncbi:MAG: Mannose-6-phosphate isomerase ManA [Chlamydiae bacterium]|nr:Mannose-6-phosphate isomerase ManA [Chlamydiota bacterium]